MFLSFEGFCSPISKGRWTNVISVFLLGRLSVPARATDARILHVYSERDESEIGCVAHHPIHTALKASVCLPTKETNSKIFTWNFALFLLPLDSFCTSRPHVLLCLIENTWSQWRTNTVWNWQQKTCTPSFYSPLMQTDAHVILFVPGETSELSFYHVLWIAGGIAIVSAYSEHLVPSCLQHQSLWSHSELFPTKIVFDILLQTDKQNSLWIIFFRFNAFHIDTLMLHLRCFMLQFSSQCLWSLSLLRCTSALVWSMSSHFRDDLFFNCTFIYPCCTGWM